MVLPLICQIMNSAKSNSQSLKYQRIKDTWIRNIEFETNNQFLNDLYINQYIRFCVYIEDLGPDLNHEKEEALKKVKHLKI